jgi:RNA polymerase sigma-70 factor (ECF subfamily)
MADSTPKRSDPAAAAPSPAQLAGWVVAVGKEKDRTAFTGLFDHFAPRLKAYLMRSGADAATAEELVQEAMVMVWRKAASFDPAKSAASTWIFTIARNKRIDGLRRENRPDIDWSDPVFEGTPPETADARLEAGEQETQLRAAIATLPREQAELLEQAFFEDKTHREIAAERDIPLGTVKSRIRLALAKLKDELDGAV